MRLLLRRIWYVARSFTHFLWYGNLDRWDEEMPE